MSLEADPILILGAPRSGTTYLQSILDRHPQISLTNELRVFDWLHRALRDLPREIGAELAQPNDFVATLARELPELLRGFYRRRAPEARWWGDKNPHYAADPALLDTVLELFPGTRFVQIVRDPRAVVASLARKQHDDGTPWIPLDQAHVMVVEHMQNGLALAGRVDPGRYVRIRYEDLVADDLAVTRGLLGALGIPVATEVERFCAQQMRERTPFSGPTTDLREAGARSAARAAWREVVPLERRRESLLMFAQLLLDLGYEDAASLDAENRSLD